MVQVTASYVEHSATGKNVTERVNSIDAKHTIEIFYPKLAQQLAAIKKVAKSLNSSDFRDACSCAEVDALANLLMVLDKAGVRQTMDWHLVRFTRASIGSEFIAACPNCETWLEGGSFTCRIKPEFIKACNLEPEKKIPKKTELDFPAMKSPSSMDSSSSSSSSSSSVKPVTPTTWGKNLPPSILTKSPEASSDPTPRASSALDLPHRPSSPRTPRLVTKPDASKDTWAAMTKKSTEQKHLF